MNSLQKKQRQNYAEAPSHWALAIKALVYHKVCVRTIARAKATPTATENTLKARKPKVFNTADQ